MNKKHTLPFLALLLLLLAACTASGGEPAESTPIVINTPAPATATATLEPTATTEVLAPATTPPQATAVPTNTSVPPTAVTVLPTDVSHVIARTDVNMRSGPGTGYNVIGWVAGGQIAKVTGISSDGGWWRVVCPHGIVASCWVTAGSQYTQPTTPPSSQPPPAACRDAATFVADVTVPDNTRFAPGATFVKTWRVRNSGTCTWNSSYALVFKNGEMMTADQSYLVPGTVAPGQTVDLSISLAAPPTPGTYRGNWQLHNAQGALFGLRNNAPLFVQIIVEAPQQPAPSTIAGVVYQDQNGNGVPDAGEPRAGNREVWFMNGNCQGGGAPIATTASAPDGVYRFTGSYSGSYCVGLRGANGLEDVASAAVSAGQVVNNLHLRTAPAAAIAGWLWHDYCSFRGGEGSPVAVDGNCVPDGNGSYRANGLVDAGETGISGVTIMLFPGPCGTDNPAIQVTAVTNGDGHYLFNGLQAGTYCVSMNAGEEPNAGRLLPGDWTYPAPGIWYHTVTLAVGEQRGSVNFGWDYQLN